MSLYDTRMKMIKDAVETTISEFSDSVPKIYKHLFFGAVDISPKYLVVWYIFKTDEDLKLAKESGMCNELNAVTINNLTKLGYPKDAFVLDEKDGIVASVEYTTDEDIQRETGGDYKCYFQ